jgi:hypothetical protein
MPQWSEGDAVLEAEADIHSIQVKEFLILGRALVAEYRSHRDSDTSVVFSKQFFCEIFGVDEYQKGWAIAPSF